MSVRRRAPVVAGGATLTLGLCKQPSLAPSAPLTTPPMQEGMPHGYCRDLSRRTTSGSPQGRARDRVCRGRWA